MFITVDTLKKFCAGEGKPEIESPFTSGGYTYAADGCILIRVPQIGSVTATAQVGLSSLPFDHDEIKDWRCIPEINMPMFSDYEIDEAVRGVGIKIDSPNTWVSVYYLALIKRYLPGPWVYSPGSDPYKAIRFKFNGGIGLVMPMKFGR